jgi:hypothetical protein
MVKKIVIGTLAIILIGAAAVGVYDWLRTAPPAAQAAQTLDGGGGQGQGGQGQGWRGGQGQAQAGSGAAVQNQNSAEPQAIPSSEWATITGVVQKVDVTGLSVTTDAGQLLWVQLGPNRFWSAGISFAAGEPVTVTGFTENGQFMAAQIANVASGQTLTLRNDLGQPLWTGGNGNH